RGRGLGERRRRVGRATAHGQVGGDPGGVDARVASEKLQRRARLVVLPERGLVEREPGERRGAIGGLERDAAVAGGSEEAHGLLVAALIVEEAREVGERGRIRRIAGERGAKRALRRGRLAGGGLELCGAIRPPRLARLRLRPRARLAERVARERRLRLAAVALLLLLVILSRRRRPPVPGGRSARHGGPATVEEAQAAAARQAAEQGD